MSEFPGNLVIAPKRKVISFQSVKPLNIDLTIERFDQISIKTFNFTGVIILLKTPTEYH